MKIKSGDIISMRMVSGEEVIAKIKTIPDNQDAATLIKNPVPVELEKPMTIFLQQTQTGVGLAMIPWINTGKDSTWLNSAHVLNWGEVDLNLHKQYEKNTTSIIGA